jgi:BMFP domain-containing protein YqiC
MNQQQRAAVQQALDALEVVWREHKAIDGLRQLLEQPVQEHDHALEQALTRLQKRYAELEAKVAAQPAAWVGLTDEQANLLINGRGDEDDDDYVEPTGDGFGLTDEDLVKLIRRVEAHHGIGVKL